MLNNCKDSLGSFIRMQIDCGNGWKNYKEILLKESTSRITSCVIRWILSLRLGLE